MNLDISLCALDAYSLVTALHALLCHVAILVTLDAELNQLCKRPGEVVVEELLILCILLDPWTRGWIANESIVGREHHQFFILRGVVLLNSLLVGVELPVLM